MAPLGFSGDRAPRTGRRQVTYQQQSLDGTRLTITAKDGRYRRQPDEVRRHKSGCDPDDLARDDEKWSEEVDPLPGGDDAR